MEVFKNISILLIVLQLSSVLSIHNSDETHKNQFPYAVLVHSPRFFCAGTLISDRHVLTAAHCLMSIPPGSEVVVNVGAYKYFGYRSTDGKKIYSKKFWMHENFKMPLAVFDIGIIELPEPLVRNDSIQWLKLSTKLNADLDTEDKEVEVAGWGYTEESDGVADELRHTTMNLIPLDECKKYKSHYIEDLNENHICIRKIKGMPCDGDSGAAIVSTKTKEIIGILSYGKDAEDGVNMHYNDCVSDIPAVSTRVSSYIDWISEKTGIQFQRTTDFDMSNNVTDSEIIKNFIRNVRDVRRKKMF